MDEMINLLTKGIGADLYKPLRISYYKFRDSLLNNVNYKKSSAREKQFLIDVLALSIFNQKVVLPFHGAANFAEGTKSMGVKRVRMATYHLDREFYQAANQVTRQYYAITKKFGLDVEDLYFSSNSEFVNRWLEYGRNNGI